MSKTSSHAEAFKEPATAWKALLTVLASFGALVVFAFVDVFAIQEQEKCYREARRVVQDIHDLRRLAKLGTAAPKELEERAAAIRSRLDSDVFLADDDNHLRVAPQSEEWLILSTGRILAGAMRWDAVRLRLNTLRYGLGIVAVLGFGITVLSLVIAAWGKHDPLKEIAEKAPLVLTWSIRSVISVPACVALSLIAVVLIFLFGELHLTSVVLKEDVKQSYLYCDLVVSGTGQAGPPAPPPTVPTQGASGGPVPRGAGN